MAAIRPLNRRDSPQAVAENLDTREPRDTVTTMIDTAHVIASRLESQLKDLHGILSPVLPLFEEPFPELVEEPSPAPKAVRQLHHLCDRMNVMSKAVEILAREVAV
ncbi:hypothetical protein [Burkholderia cenocepacia]|uniref:hypothetical protein n=1 Tax=Burkholderia cenocepacia TaxID=95486 RepID=UPI0009903307|nr:hypothetical protein [Burkholderia cenocepacia]AQT48797.1 hypothetical protein BHQ31_01490 [Burkholderia cenocepacia]MBJ9727740.1 hypothetical protein [Burkholderia cenocepacia]